VALLAVRRSIGLLVRRIAKKTERIKGAHEHCRRKYAANIRLLQLHLKTHTPPHREPRPELEHTKKNKYIRIRYPRITIK